MSPRPIAPRLAWKRWRQPAPHRSGPGALPECHAAEVRQAGPARGCPYRRPPSHRSGSARSAPSTPGAPASKTAARPQSAPTGPRGRRPTRPRGARRAGCHLLAPAPAASPVRRHQPRWHVHPAGQHGWMLAARQQPGRRTPPPASAADEGSPPAGCRCPRPGDRADRTAPWPIGTRRAAHRPQP